MTFIHEEFGVLTDKADEATAYCKKLYQTLYSNQDLCR